MDWLESRQHLEGELAEAFFADVDWVAALRAADGAAFGERGENHVFEGVAIAEGVKRALFEHALVDFLRRRLRGSDETARAVRAEEFDLHGKPPWLCLFQGHER